MQTIKFFMLVGCLSCVMLACGCADNNVVAPASTSNTAVAMPPNGFFIGNDQIENLERLFSDGLVQEREGESFQFRLIDAGDLHLATGQLVAADLRLDPTQAIAFDRKVQPGVYPAGISLVEFSTQQRVGGIRITFSDQPVSTWELATVAGNDVSNLKTGQFVGFTTESSLSFLGDLQTVSSFGVQLLDKKSELSQRVSKAMETMDGRFANFVFDESDVATKNAGEDQVKVNAIVSASGWGEGTYASYFGLSESGEAVCLILDFNVANEYSD